MGADRMGAADEVLAQLILDLAAARGAGRSISPMDVARAAAGDHPDAWSPLMPPVRRVAVALMKQGRIVILRKGRPVEPDDFRGVYRIRIAAPDGPGPGNTEST